MLAGMSALPSPVRGAPQETPASSPLAQMETPSVNLPNPARVTLRIVSGSSFAIGDRIGFEVAAATRGYVLLVDIDPTGRMTQIFPNPELLERLGDGKVNLIAANGKLAIPSADLLKRGIAFAITEPKGLAMVIAILSQKPLHLIDLPDERAIDSVAALSRLLKWVDQLRIVDPGSGKLLSNTWSYDHRRYEIR